MIKGGPKDTAKVVPILIPIPNPDRPDSNIVTKPIKIKESVPPLIPNPKPDRNTRCHIT